jgi:hypothetical protein
MANTEHVAKLREGVQAWHVWRRNNPEVRPDLSGLLARREDFSRADLRKGYLPEIDFQESNLSYVNLSGANAIGAKLSHANLFNAWLDDANLYKAKLIKANLFEASLNRARLCKADLSWANLGNAKLQGADLSQANLTGTDLTRANLSEANLSGATLYRAAMVQTNLTKAVLTNCRIYGMSVWDANLEGALQSNLVVTLDDQPQIQVDNLEVAQFVYLLLSREKLRGVITTIGEKAVLILGRFTERKELLDGMADKLRSLGYLPMIFDFDRPTDRDLTETVRILAGLSRFVIADITNPRSVPLELQATVPDYMVPFVTILQRGQPAFGMFDDLPRKYHWALPLLEYNNGDTLLATFEQKVVNPALEKAQEVRIQKATAPVRRSAED